jgi:hypothetical protein
MQPLDVLKGWTDAHVNDVLVWQKVPEYGEAWAEKVNLLRLNNNRFINAASNLQREAAFYQLRNNLPLLVAPLEENKEHVKPIESIIEKVWQQLKGVIDRVAGYFRSFSDGVAYLLNRLWSMIQTSVVAILKQIPLYPVKKCVRFASFLMILTNEVMGKIKIEEQVVSRKIRHFFDFYWNSFHHLLPELLVKGFKWVYTLFRTAYALSISTVIVGFVNFVIQFVMKYIDPIFRKDAEFLNMTSNSLKTLADAMEKVSDKESNEAYKRAKTFTDSIENQMRKVDTTISVASKGSKLLEQVLFERIPQDELMKQVDEIYELKYGYKFQELSFLIHVFTVDVQNSEKKKIDGLIFNDEDLKKLKEYGEENIRSSVKFIRNRVEELRELIKAGKERYDRLETPSKQKQHEKNILDERYKAFNLYLEVLEGVENSRRFWLTITCVALASITLYMFYRTYYNRDIDVKAKNFFNERFPKGDTWRMNLLKEAEKDNLLNSANHYITTVKKKGILSLEDTVSKLGDVRSVEDENLLYDSMRNLLDQNDLLITLRDQSDVSSLVDRFKSKPDTEIFSPYSLAWVKVKFDKKRETVKLVDSVIEKLTEAKATLISDIESITWGPNSIQYMIYSWTLGPIRDVFSWFYQSDNTSFEDVWERTIKSLYEPDYNSFFLNGSTLVFAGIVVAGIVTLTLVSIFLLVSVIVDVYIYKESPDIIQSYVSRYYQVLLTVAGGFFSTGMNVLNFRFQTQVQMTVSYLMPIAAVALVYFFPAKIAFFLAGFLKTSATKYGMSDDLLKSLKTTLGNNRSMQIPDDEATEEVPIPPPPKVPKKIEIPPVVARKVTETVTQTIGLGGRTLFKRVKN